MKKHWFSILAISFIAFIIILGIIGSNKESKNEEQAIEMVKNYKPNMVKVSLLEIMAYILDVDRKLNIVSFEGWAAEKSSEDIYRVSFHLKRNTIENEVVFAIDIKSGQIRGLNEEANNYLSIQRNWER